MNCPLESLENLVIRKGAALFCLPKFAFQMSLGTIAAEMFTDVVGISCTIGTVVQFFVDSLN